MKWLISLLLWSSFLSSLSRLTGAADADAGSESFAVDGTGLLFLAAAAELTVLVTDCTVLVDEFASWSGVAVMT